MDALDSAPLVNPSAVPHRSPFRYPGGKIWLVPRFCEWLRSLSPRPAHLIEPFAGGAAISLAAVAEGLVARATFCEMDREVAAVWKTIMGPDRKALAQKILHFEFDPDKVAVELNHEPDTTLDTAWRTILRNRVHRGGILADGAGKLKLGENSRGLGSRWYPKTLAHRIESIGLLTPRLRFVEGDGLALLDQHAEDTDAVFYLDPPYLKAAKRLYRHWQMNHEKLFSQLSKCRGAALLSYDDDEEIRALATRFEFEIQLVPMKSTHHVRRHELLLIKPSR